MSINAFFFQTSGLASKKIFFTSSPYTILIQGSKRLYCLFFLLCISFTTLGQDQLLGLTSIGGRGGVGTVFSIKTTGSEFSVVRSFTKGGRNPVGNLIKGSDGLLYGMTPYGGIYDKGTIFKITTAGTATILRHLDTPDGINPLGSLVKAPDNNFYGMTNAGGKYNYGTIFRITSSGAFTLLHHFIQTNFDNQGASPSGNLIVKDGYLYGMTTNGGIGNDGVVFRILPTGLGFEILKGFYRMSTGRYPKGNLVQGTDGNLYGMTSEGINDYYSIDEKHGSIFRISASGQFTLLYDMGANPNTTGFNPYGSLIKGKDGNLYGMMRQGGPLGGGTIFKLTGTGGSYAVIGKFDLFTTGGNPQGSLTDPGDGYLYGTTSNGGQYGKGTLFKFSLSTKVITVLRHLNVNTDGNNPRGSLYKNSDGYFYGMATNGGNTALDGIGNGVVFRIKADGTGYSNRTIFPDGGKGMNPQKNLLLAKDGSYYGTTLNGGKYGFGTLFKLSSTGAFTTLYSFNRNVDGGNPKGSLMQAADGHLYGLTSKGGQNNYGTLFRWSTTSGYSVLYHFSYAIGANPEGKLLQLENGTFYGTTRNGGAHNSGVVFKFTLPNIYTVMKHLDSSTGSFPTGDLKYTTGEFWGMTRTKGAAGFGTMFRMSLDGVFSVAVNFDLNSGGLATGSLIQAIDGVLYGLTNTGGLYNGGTLFRYTISKKVFRVLYHFATGSKPVGTIAEGSDGTFYGLTSGGGNYGAGTIFTLTYPDRVFSTLYSFNPATDGSTPLGSLIIKKAIPSSSPILATTNWVEESNESTTLNDRLYPNPTEDKLTITLTEPTDQVKVTVVTSLGTEVLPEQVVTTSSHTMEMKVSNLPRGFYYLQLETVKGKKAFKFLKQ